MKLAEFWSSAKAWLWARPAGAAFALGLLLFAGGLSWVWPPLGLIGAGLIVMGVSLFGGRKQP